MTRFLWLVSFICGLSLSVSALDREAFTFTKYDLDMRIEPEQQRLGVRGKITLRNDSQTPQKNAVLQISSSLTWRSIRIADKPVDFITQPYTSDIDHTGALSEAIVTLPVEVAPKSGVELEIGYEGIIPLDATRLTRIGVPQETAKHADWDQIAADFSAVRGIGYVAWYPVALDAANLSEKNTVEEAVARWKAREASAVMALRLKYYEVSDEPPPIGLCNGKMEDGFVESVGPPHMGDLECSFAPFDGTVPSFVLGRYETISTELLDAYYLAGHKAFADAYAASVGKVSSFVTGWFGTPDAKVLVAEFPDSQAVPFESGNLLLVPLVGAGSKQNELTVVRQLAHATVNLSRAWIHEGLTHFAQALYREQQDGRTAALEFMKAHEDVMLAAEKARATENQSGAENSLVNTSLEEFYRSKAMYVWWMLRDMVGDAALKSALAAYKPDQDKEPSYMQRLLEGETKKDLEWFFDDWVYRDKGLPDFRIVSVYPRKTLKDTYLVTVTVENLGDAAAEVPVIAHFAGLESKERLLVKGKSQGSIRVATSRLPEDVVVNDGSVPESDMSNNTFKVEASSDK